MSDYDDRGAYTPPSDRLAFDPRQPVRGGGPAPVTLIVSGLVLVALVGGVFFLYRDGFRHRGDGPALVGAPVAEVKTASAAQASPPAALVVDKTAGAPPAPAFAPPPESQLPPPPQEAALPRPAPLAVTPTAAPSPPAAAPPVAFPPVRHASAPTAVRTAPAPAPQVVTLATDPAPKVHAAPPTPRPAAVPAATHPVRHAAPMTIASLTDDALDRRAHDHAPPHAKLAHTAPTAAAAAAPAPKPRPAAAAAPAPTAGPAAGWVQIGAFSSSTLADQGWRDIARLEPDVMAGKGKAVQPLERDGKTLYRAYVTGFASVTAAQAFCAELQASGKSCMVK